MSTSRSRSSPINVARAAVQPIAWWMDAAPVLDAALVLGGQFRTPRGRGTPRGWGTRQCPGEPSLARAFGKVVHTHHRPTLKCQGRPLSNVHWAEPSRRGSRMLCHSARHSYNSVVEGGHFEALSPGQRLPGGVHFLREK